MLIKIFKNKGKGSAKASIDYLLDKDRNRELATVLKGNPELSLELAQSLAFSNKYTVGCLSFEEADLPKKSKLELMEKFEEMVFAGLTSEQFNISWIEHRDKGRLELNFFIPNVELTTGKRYQNYQYQLSDPHDPTKRQLCKFEFSADMQQSKIKENLTALIADGITQQHISSREDIIELLKQSGFKIERTTEKSISISHPALKKNIRLSGAIYEHREFNGEFAEEFRRETGIYQSRTGERIKQAQTTFEQLFQRRAEFNQQKYTEIKPLVNSPNPDYQHNLSNATEYLNRYTILSEQQDRQGSNRFAEPQSDIQPITSQRSCKIEFIREQINSAAENSARTRENLSKSKWQLHLRDLQIIGIEYAQRIQHRIERLFNRVRTEFAYFTDRKRAITISEQRIKQSERTISAAQQLITNTNKTITRTIEQQIVQKPNCKIRI